MDIIIKSFTGASKSIIEEMIQIDKDVFGDENSWAEQEFFKKLPYKLELSAYALSDNKLIGYIISSAYQGHSLSGHINRIAVDKKSRGLNVGKMLIEYFENSIRELPINVITLEFDTEINVEEFYRKLGYNQIQGIDNIKKYLKEKNKISKKELYLSMQRKIFYKEFNR